VEGQGGLVGGGRVFGDEDGDGDPGSGDFGEAALEGGGAAGFVDGTVVEVPGVEAVLGGADLDEEGVHGSKECDFWHKQSAKRSRELLIPFSSLLMLYVFLFDTYSNSSIVRRSTTGSSLLSE